MSRFRGSPAGTADFVVPVAELVEVAERLRVLAASCEALVARPETREPIAPKFVSAGDASKAEIAARIRIYQAARRKRASILGHGWFEDPAWELLLDLLAAEYERKTVSISSGCIATGVPPTTGLRWVQKLVEASAIRRIDDEHDKRRSYLRVAPDVAERLAAWVLEYLPSDRD